MTALAEFVREQATALERTAGQSGAAASLEVKSAGDFGGLPIESLGGPTADKHPRRPLGVAPVALDVDVKTELTRSLGVTASTLNTMLAKL